MEQTGLGHVECGASVGIAMINRLMYINIFMKNIDTAGIIVYNHTRNTKLGRKAGFSRND